MQIVIVMMMLFPISRDLEKAISDSLINKYRLQQPIKDEEIRINEN